MPRQFRYREDAMRRLLLSTAGLMPLVLLFGCNHMAGMCDCAFTPTITCPCYGHVAVPAPAPLKPVEPIKERPNQSRKRHPRRKRRRINTHRLRFPSVSRHPSGIAAGFRWYCGLRLSGHSPLSRKRADPSKSAANSSIRLPFARAAAGRHRRLHNGDLGRRRLHFVQAPRRILGRDFQKLFLTAHSGLPSSGVTR